MGSELERARELRKAYDEAVVQEGRELAGPFMTVSGAPIERLYDATDVAGHRLRARHQPPRLLPVHPRRPPHRLPRQALDDPHVQRLRLASKRRTSATRTCSPHGNNGLSVAFDMPTLMGYDHDDPWAEGEFGSCGVAVDSLSDMDILLDATSRSTDITTSMTINSPAPVIWALFIAAAEKRGVPRAKLAGTLQNDILKEYIAQNEYIYPPEHSMRLVDRHDRVRLEGDAALEPRQRQRLPHPRSRLDGRPGARLHPRRRHRVREVGPRPRPRHRFLRRRASASSSTATTTSSKRSRSSAPPAASGRARCANASARRTNARGSCASTPRPPASRSPSSSPR